MFIYDEGNKRDEGIFMDKKNKILKLDDVLQ